MKEVSSVRALMASCAWVAGLAVAVPAAAQDAGQSGAREEFSLEEIIVTATRREERLQDVPVAVTAVSGADLARSAFQEVRDIEYLAPNVTFSATNPVSNGGGYQIRGIGTQTYDSGVEQTVGLVVDGVVIGLSRDPGATGFADIARVEVLRGPQGTLFGKNASAGVIQIISNSPKLDEASLSVDLGYGERNDRLARATANLPLGETMALRVSGFYNGQDGAIPNIVNGTDVGDRENKGIRGKLLWEPGENLSVLATAEYQTAFARDAHTIESLGLSAAYNAQFAGFEVQPGHGVYVAFSDGDWTADTELWAASLQVDYQIGEATLTSITAYRDLQTLQISDVDAAPIDVFNHSDGGVDSNQFSQELRLDAGFGERLDYTLGLYYYRTDNAGDIVQYGNVYGLYGLPVVTGSGIRTQQNIVRSLAAFGNVSYALTDTLKLIGGLRYTDDRNHGSLEVTPLDFPAIPISVAVPYDAKVQANDVSGRIGLQFEPTDDLMLYATYTTGYKGPAIDGTGGVINEVDPETVKSYEAGLKSTLLDGRMTFNATLYSSEFSNFQTTALDLGVTPPSFLLTNAGLMRARGAEVELTWKVTPDLRLSMNGAYNDSSFRDFTGPCYAGQPVSPVVGEGCYLLPGTTTSVANYAGYALPNAPEWSYSLRADYSRPVSDTLVFDANANWSWRDDHQAVLGDPNAQIDAYGIMNAGLGIGAETGKWRVGVYARNLFDKQYYAAYSGGTFNPGGYYRIMSPNAFRTIGVSASFQF